MDLLSSFLIIALILYSLFVSYLYYAEIKNRESYLKDKIEYVNKKHQELDTREKDVIGREKCMTDFTKLKTINESAVKILQSFVV